MDHLSPQQNSGTQHGDSKEDGNTHSNILRGSTSSADNASARNDESGENTAASPNLDTTDHQKTCDKDNVPPKPQMEGKGAQTNTNEFNPVTSPNTATNGHSVSSSNAGGDDKVTSRYTGNDDTNPSQQQTDTILADNPDALGVDFASMKPQPGLTRRENGRRTEEEEYSKTTFGSASESSDPSIELPSLTGLHRSRHDGKQRGDEPVLTLYRRHSEDPFFMYNAISNIHTSDPPAQNTGHAAVIDLNPGSSESSTARQANSVMVDGSVHSGLEKGTTTGASRGMPVIHEAVGVSAGRVSLNGIHVGVKKKPPVKKMAKMQSPRVQCCMCAVSVMSALFGMFMLSAGVCLVLNYNFLDVDTSGLPPNLHNEEGKKVVGIILICVGIAALGVSGLVSILFYTACSRSSSSSSSSSKKGGEGEVEDPLSSQDSHGRHGYYNSNGTTPVRHPPANGVSGARRSGGAAAPLPGGRRGNDPRGRGPAAMPGVGREGAAAYTRGSGTAGRNGVPPSGSRPYRAGKKSRHHNQGRFRNSLPSHPEEACAEAHSLGGSRRLASSARRQTVPNASGYVNQGAQLDDDPVIASGSSESTVTPAVVIKVDSSYLHEKADPASLSPPQQGQSDAELTKHSSSAVASASAASSESSRGSVDLMDNDREDVVKEGADEEESGRTSRSTVDSPDITEGSEESPEDVSKRLDAQITTLLS